MQLERQKVSLPMTNYDTYIGLGESEVSKHGLLFPNSFRCIITGPSNCGKTNALFNLLLNPNGVNFENLYVFSKSLNQKKYKFLANVLPDDIGYYAFDDNTIVPHPSEAKPNSIMVFDDISCEKHDNIRNYFTMGRHNNIDTIYLGQSYSKIPKQLIRDNCNFIVLFKQDSLNLKHIHRDHVNTDLTLENFHEMCRSAWKEKYGFLVIDKDSEPGKGRYRIGFDTFVKAEG